MTAQVREQKRHKTRGGTATSDPRPRRARPAPPATAPKTPRDATARSATPRKPRNTASHPAEPTLASAPPRDRRSPAQMLLPPVAPCDDLMALFALDADAARDHVDAMLHAAMPAAQADAFEARAYRWELHLVALDQLCLLRAVDLVPSRIRRYRAALRRGASCTPLIGLGGDGKSPAEDVLLCDGYHRAVALRDAGIHFAWVWLAVAAWKDATDTAEEPVA